MMTGELVYEMTSYGDAAVLVQPWLRLDFAGPGDSVSAQPVTAATELGLADPATAADAANAAVRVWPRDTTLDGDAQIVLSWLRANAVSDRLGIDTDILVQLFIEATADPGIPPVFDGGFLADLAGAGDSAAATTESQWRLTVHLSVEAVEAVLDAIADSSPRWRYAIIAARDPESPAGRVRRTILADRGR